MFQTFIILGISILATATAHLLLRKGMLLIGQLEFSLPNLIGLIYQVFHNLYLLGGLIFFSIAFFLYLFVLSKIQLNLVYPISISLNLCLITIASWFLFKEYLSFYQILGTCLIIFGVFILLKP